MILKLLTIMVLSLLFAACGDSSPPNTVQQQLQQMLTTNYTAYKTANNLPENAGALLYVQSPRGTSVTTAGFTTPVNETYHFRIASNTKTFTAAAIMLLDQQGRLNIDHYLTDMIPAKSVPYLPATSNYEIPNKISITIKQLLAHRAGVYDITNDPLPTTSLPQSGSAQHQPPGLQQTAPFRSRS